MTLIWPFFDACEILTNFPNGLTLKLQDFQKRRDDKITWHEVIKALSRLVFWKYKLRGKLLLKIKLSYCSCPLTPWAGPSGHLGPLERYKRFMQSPRARYREYRSKSWRDRVIKSDLTNHVPFFLSCDWPIKMRHDIWHMLQVLFFQKFSQNSIDLKIKKSHHFTTGINSKIEFEPGVTKYVSPDPMKRHMSLSRLDNLCFYEKISFVPSIYLKICFN